jgi:D-sedoheptulose 7-phosphate isomerase
MNLINFKKYFKSIYQTSQLIDVDKLAEVVKLVKSVKDKSKKIILVGNGGSAAIASHVAVDFTKSAHVRAVNFNDAELITCFANDYGYQHWVAEALKAYADPNDLIILISSSGKSLNIINGAIQAKTLGLKIVTVSGFSPDNPLRKLGNVDLWADSSEYNVVEITHQIWLAAIVDYVTELNKEMDSI